MTFPDQMNEFVLTIRTMPQDELAAYGAILLGLILVIVAGIVWLP